MGRTSTDLPAYSSSGCEIFPVEPAFPVICYHFASRCCGPWQVPTQPLAIICFGVNSVLLGLSSWLAWSHASGDGHFLDDNADPNLVAIISRLWFSTPVVFFLTIPLAFLNVYVVYLLWLILPIVSYMSIGAYMKQARRN